MGMLARLAAALALSLGAASGTVAAPIPQGSAYVAMGSSYAAGPGVTRRAEGSLPRCAQSQDNYPRQLARALGLKLVDRSCSGATTADVLGTGPLGLPPQVDGITPDTRLVTVTIGGNDVRYMADLSAAVCRRSPELFPEALRARACAAPTDFDLESAFASMAANLTAIALEVRRRAPDARLVFVDYVTVLPAGAPCAATPIGDADARALRARAERLAAVTAQAARRAGADLLQASRLSEGHDACAADAWVEGYAPRPPGAAWPPASFHPRLAAMTAIARQLETQLASPAPPRPRER